MGARERGQFRRAAYIYGMDSARVGREGLTSSGLLRRALRLLIAILAGYIIALILMRVFESHFLFFPDYPGRLSGDWTPKGLSVEDTWFKSTDGTKLHSWWIANEEPAYTFLAFHGNAGNIADRAWVYKFLHDVHANVFAVEYRGYGKSEGVPSESGFYLDAQAAFDYLVATKRIAPQKIISFGQSLGTAVAANPCSATQRGWSYFGGTLSVRRAGCTSESVILSRSSSSSLEPT